MVRDEQIKNFYNEICENMGDNYKIILEPGRMLNETWIEYDGVQWEIEDTMKDLVAKLQNDAALTIEEKIFELYKYICLHYIYDANVLYFFRRDDSDQNNVKYIAVDWYGRIVGQDWINNRKKHNRRICYEFSRFYAKAINQLIGNSTEMEAVMVGDVENTHYVVGLIGNDYSIILDPDDFSSIKDLTRVKLGLSINGIHIFRDEKNVFTNMIAKYNENKPEHLSQIEAAKVEYREKDFIKYIHECINALKKFDVDSQGFFEYIRFLIEEHGITVKKIWKIDTRDSAIERRHERCLYFEYKNKTYLLDSIDKSLDCTDIKMLDKTVFIFKPEENEYTYYGC